MANIETRASNVRLDFACIFMWDRTLNFTTRGTQKEQRTSVMRVLRWLHMYLYTFYRRWIFKLSHRIVWHWIQKKLILALRSRHTSVLTRTLNVNKLDLQQLTICKMMHVRAYARLSIRRVPRSALAKSSNVRGCRIEDWIFDDEFATTRKAIQRWG